MIPGLPFNPMEWTRYLTAAKEAVQAVQALTEAVDAFDKASVKTYNYAPGTPERLEEEQEWDRTVEAVTMRNAEVKNLLAKLPAQFKGA